MSETISVLMPVYNRENFLCRSISSILNQSYTNLELIIYSDGSTDKSVEIIKKFMNDDNRIKLISYNKNMGVGYARNMLLQACFTKYACWQDSDDISYPDRLETQIKYINPLEHSLIFANWENMNTKKVGTTQGFATLLFPVDKTIQFNEDKQWGGEDWEWIEVMRERYTNEIDIQKTLYAIDFHNDRIGYYKRKLCKEWGGIYSEEELEGLTYEEAIKKFKEKS